MSTEDRVRDSSVHNPSWLASKRGCLELFAISAIMISFLTIPFIVKELFPFSAATMFAYRCDELATYRIRDPDGRELDDYTLGLSYGPNIFDPPVDTLGRFGYGRKAPPSVFKPGTANTVASKDEVSKLVQQRLIYQPHIQYVLITQTIYGAKDPKTVGIVRQSTWKVQRTE